MPPAARVSDKTDHPGELAPAGHLRVTVNGLPSTTMGDRHTCTRHPACNPIIVGSSTVTIGGLPAARREDLCECGAIISPPCSPDVIIGGQGLPYSALQSQNCYGYASGVNDFRQPGQTSGNPVDSLGELNAATVRARLEADLGPPMEISPKVVDPFLIKRRPFRCSHSSSCFLLS